jgi:hypothetical protein
MERNLARVSIAIIVEKPRMHEMVPIYLKEHLDATWIKKNTNEPCHFVFIFPVVSIKKPDILATNQRFSSVDTNFFWICLGKSTDFTGFVGNPTVYCYRSWVVFDSQTVRWTLVRIYVPEDTYAHARHDLCITDVLDDTIGIWLFAEGNLSGTRQSMLCRVPLSAN